MHNIADYTTVMKQNNEIVSLYEKTNNLKGGFLLVIILISIAG